MADYLYINTIEITPTPNAENAISGTSVNVKVNIKEGLFGTDDNNNGLITVRFSNVFSSNPKWDYFTLDDEMLLGLFTTGYKIGNIPLQNNFWYRMEIMVVDDDGMKLSEQVANFAGMESETVLQTNNGFGTVIYSRILKTGDRQVATYNYTPDDTSIRWYLYDDNIANTNYDGDTGIDFTCPSRAYDIRAALYHLKWDEIIADLKSKGVSVDNIIDISLGVCLQPLVTNSVTVDVSEKTSRAYDTTVETWNTVNDEDGNVGQNLVKILDDYTDFTDDEFTFISLPNALTLLKANYNNDNFIYDIRISPSGGRVVGVFYAAENADISKRPVIKITYDDQVFDYPTHLEPIPEIGIEDGFNDRIDLIWGITKGDNNQTCFGTFRYRIITDGVAGEWSGNTMMSSRSDNYVDGKRKRIKSTNINGIELTKVLKYNLYDIPDFDESKQYEFEITVFDDDEQSDKLFGYNSPDFYPKIEAASFIGTAFYPEFGYRELKNISTDDNMFKSTQENGNPGGYFIANYYIDGVLYDAMSRVELFEFNDIGEYKAKAIRTFEAIVDPPWDEDDTIGEDITTVDTKQIKNINPILEAVGNTVPVIITYENDMGTGNTPATMAIAYKKTTVGWPENPTYISLTRDNANKRFIGNLSNLDFEESYDARIKVIDADGVNGTEDTTAYVDSSFSTTAVEANLILGTETITPGVWNIAVEIPFTNPVGSNPALYNYSAAIQWKKTVDDEYGSSVPMLLTQIDDVSGNFTYDITELIDNSEYDVKIIFTNTLGIDGTNPLIITNILTLPYDQLTPTLTEPNGTEDIDGEFTITWTLNGDDVVPTSEQRTEIQVYDGLKYPWYVQDNEWKLITITDAGIESYLYNFGQLLSTEVARVRIRTISVKSGITYKSEWDYSDQVFQIINNTPPDAPTDLTPDNTWEDLANIILFSWKHNGRTTQTRAELYWQDRAVPGYTKIDITGKNYYYVMPANALPDSDIQWYIKTYCIVNGVETVSPSSYVAQFRASELSTSPVITYPIENDLIGIANIICTWTVDDQVAYQVRLVDNDTTTEIYNSGELISTTKNHSIDYDLEHGKNYTVYVKTQNSSENWSAEDENTFDVSFISPEKPVITVYPNSTDYAIEISCDNPVGGIEVDRNDLWRFDTESETAILIASDMGSYYEDNTVAGSVRYYYFVQTWGTNGTYVYSDIKSTEISIEGCELRDSVDTGLFVRFEAYPEQNSVDFGNGTSLTKFQGREYPVSSTGTLSDKVYNLGLDVFTLVNRNKVKQMFKDKNHLLYRDDKQNRDYIMILKYSEVPYNEADEWFKIDLTIAKVDHSEGTVMDNIRHLPIDNIDEALRG